MLVFSLSWLSPLVAPEELELDGVLELELGWLLVEPAPALPDIEPDAEPELGADDAPPPALFFSSVDEEAAPELLGEEGWVALDEDEAEPEGEDGVVVAPEGEDVEPEDDAAPEPGVVRPAEPVLLSPQAARPKARVTAAARIESFMCSPPWLGYGVGSKLRTRLGPGPSPRGGALVAVLPVPSVVRRIRMVVWAGRARGGASPRLRRLVAAGGEGKDGGERNRYQGSHGDRSVLSVRVSLYLQGPGRTDLSPGGHGDIPVT